MSVKEVARVARATFILTYQVALRARRLVMMATRRLLAFAVTTFSVFCVNRSFRAINQAFCNHCHVQIYHTALGSFRAVFCIIMVRSSGVAKRRRIFSDVHSVRYAYQDRTERLVFRFLYNDVVSVYVVSASNISGHYVGEVGARGGSFGRERSFKLF